jgi:REP element-mobilizing transposase RayT
VSHWNLDPPPNFQGLDPSKPLVVYRRQLPHLRQPGATYFVTFRQADSLPLAKRLELHKWRETWNDRNPEPHTTEQLNELWSSTFRRIERWLDQGLGSCRLRSSSARRKLVDALHHFENERYELGSYIIMPNHAHVVVRPFEWDAKALSRVVQGWKGTSACEINRLIKAAGQLWQSESYDRIVRDEEHLWRVIQYIGRNAMRAGLRDGEYTRWINPNWHALGWRFVDDP